ncbi:MAG: conjugative transposon protein TraM [Bacteroidetes bacterium]|nr:conjugative transposon protein TraM [Bacteroidota bacterium]
METKHSAKFLRQRKMMLVLPLLVLPFITMAFWALGGGQGTADKNQTAVNAGLNLQLPKANLKDDKNEDKLSFYKEADADSLKRAELLRNDPYYRDSTLANQTSLMDATAGLNNPAFTKTGLNISPYKTSADINEQKIYQKIAELNKQINLPETTETNVGNSNQSISNNEGFSNDIDRLHNMMQVMNDKEATDPEMQQLNGTLDKILDIQHPERVKDKIREKSLQQKQVVFAVSKSPVTDNISLLDTSKHKTLMNAGFYGIEESKEQSEEDNSIDAVVHADQTLVNGAVIKLRLTTGIYINGSLIPKGNFVYGIAALNDERLEVEINSIRNGSSLFPVKLEVYDMDGLPGIHIPGAITRDVAKQSADNGLQLMELTSVDPSLKAQAAAAGISSMKSLLSRKVKQVKVLVKAGYKVLLKDKNGQQ